MHSLKSSISASWQAKAVRQWQTVQRWQPLQPPSLNLLATSLHRSSRGSPAPRYLHIYLFVCLEVLYLSASCLRGYHSWVLVALPSYGKTWNITSVADVRDSSELCLASGTGSSSHISFLSLHKAGTLRVTKPGLLMRWCCNTAQTAGKSMQLKYCPREMF